MNFRLMYQTHGRLFVSLTRRKNVNFHYVLANQSRRFATRSMQKRALVLSATYEYGDFFLKAKGGDVYGAAGNSK